MDTVSIEIPLTRKGAFCYNKVTTTSAKRRYGTEEKLMKYANLHLHSTYSDAQFTPSQLFMIGKSLGYRALALTDHETDGGVPELMKYAKEQGGVDIISGIEFYGKYREDLPSLHLVALDYDMDEPGIRAFVKDRVERRYEFTKKGFELGKERGMFQDITWDEIMQFCGENTWVCHDQIFNAYRHLHRPLPERLSVVRGIYRSPEMLEMKPKYPTAEQVIKVVRGAGGIVALAHPTKQTHIVRELVDMGLNGIEVCHPDISEETVNLALEAAKTYNLYHCGGTDHTGVMSGSDGKNCTVALQGVTEEEYMIIKERRKG